MFNMKKRKVGHKKKSKSRIKRVVNRLKKIDGYGFNALLMLMSITVLFYAGFFYMVNYHNLDLSYNMALMTNDINGYFHDNNISKNFDYRSFRDRYDIGKSLPYSNFYIFASDNMVTLLFLAIISSVCFGFSFAYNVLQYDNLKFKRKK